MTAKLTIRIDEAELEQLRELASEQKRSVNQQVLFLIHQAIDEQEKDQAS